MDKFTFDPPKGLLDKDVFPSNPQTEEGARGQFMKLFNQIKDYLNKFLDNFIVLKGESGYVKFPKGIIIQWGSTHCSPAGVMVEFLTPFTMTHPVVVASAFDDAASVNPVTVYGGTPWSTKVYIRASANAKVSWVAIGY